MAELHVPHAAHDSGDGANPGVHHEERDVDIASILAFGAGLVVVALVVHLLIWVLFRYFEAREARQDIVRYPLAVEQEHRVPPEPRLQTNPRQDLQDLRTQEDETLTTYGWVDKNAGVVRIPIDEAMKLTVQRGLPSRSGQQR